MQNKLISGNTVEVERKNMLHLKRNLKCSVDVMSYQSGVGKCIMHVIMGRAGSFSHFAGSLGLWANVQ